MAFNSIPFFELVQSLLENADRESVSVYGMAGTDSKPVLPGIKLAGFIPGIDFFLPGNLPE